MKTICKSGFKISAQDKKAFAHYVLKSESDWSFDALKGLINKAVKSIFRDWFDVYKAKATGPISADKSVLIPAIVAMPEFKPYNHESSANNKAERKHAVDIEIWPVGFDIEDYEYAAIKAYFIDPEQTMRDLMENKIALRKAAMMKECETLCMNDAAITEMPSTCDDMIDFMSARPGYKNRAQLESAILTI